MAPWLLKLKKFLPNKGDGEIAQLLRALIALSEVLSSIANNHVAAHNHLF